MGFFPNARFLGAMLCTSLGLFLSPFTFESPVFAADESVFPLLSVIDEDRVPHSLPGRFALVVGIDRYAQPRNVNLSTLPSAINDAVSVANVLHDKAKFDVTLLTPYENPQNDEGNRGKFTLITRSNILYNIGALARKAKDSKNSTHRDPVVLVYFAGHGLSDLHDDYLIPADFNPFFAEDVPDTAISISQILLRLQEANPALRVVITDSCRNNAPVSLSSLKQTTVEFRAGSSVSGSDRAIGAARDGSRIIYATLKDGVSYSDGDSGRFTGEFINNINTVFENIRNAGPQATSAGAGIHELYQGTRNVIMARSENQVPQESGAGPDFNLFPTKADFDEERKSWTKYTHLAPLALTKDVDIDGQRYCLMRTLRAKSRSNFVFRR